MNDPNQSPSAWPPRADTVPIQRDLVRLSGFKAFCWIVLGFVVCGVSAWVALLFLLVIPQVHRYQLHQSNAAIQTMMVWLFGSMAAAIVGAFKAFDYYRSLVRAENRRRGHSENAR